MKLLRNKMLIAKETIREIFLKDHPTKDLCHNLTLRGAEMPSKRGVSEGYGNDLPQT
jgi:hypothetical protein